MTGGPGFEAATLPDLLARAVERYGDRVAIRSAEAGGLETVSYAELNVRSASLRDRLGSVLTPGGFVVLSGRNSIAWIVALFAITRAGGVPVPLDAETAPDVLSLILDELTPAAVLADREFLDRTEGVGRLRLALDGRDAGNGETAQRARGDADAAPAPEDLAVVIYTAGTTGRPKGVMLSHRNLMSNVAAVIEVAGLSEGDAVFVVLPLYHGFPLNTGCLAAIAAGVTIELEHQPARVAARLPLARPTVLLGVPSLYATVLRGIRHRAGAGWRGRYLRAALALNRWLIRLLGVNAGRLLFRPVHQALGGRLRYAVSGGAALPATVQREAFLFGIPLLQGYGMSEASPVISIQRFDRRRFQWTQYYWNRVGSVGQPVQGVHVTVEDALEGEPGSGELVVSGPNVMMGYFQREEETHEALEDGRLRTGDVGHVDASGDIWITGRRKLAVSTPGGETVHLDRVETALQEVPEVAQVCVMEEREPSWRLVAVVFPAIEALGASDATQAEVESRVRAGIAAASRGLRQFERVREITLTDTPMPATRLGKIQRGELPAAFGFDLDRWRQEVRRFEAGDN